MVADMIKSRVDEVKRMCFQRRYTIDIAELPNELRDLIIVNNSDFLIYLSNFK